jgi:hypothetical protein
MQFNHVCIHINANFGVFHCEAVLAFKIDKQDAKLATSFTGHISDKVQHYCAVLARTERQIHALKIIERAVNALASRLKNGNSNWTLKHGLHSRQKAEALALYGASPNGSKRARRKRWPRLVGA